MLREACGNQGIKVAKLGVPDLVRVGRAGHGRHGGGALAMCGWPLMSALILRSLLIKEKGRRKKDPPFPLRVREKVVILQRETQIGFGVD